jgi:hypothetical protein
MAYDYASLHLDGRSAVLLKFVMSKDHQAAL